MKNFLRAPIYCFYIKLYNYCYHRWVILLVWKILQTIQLRASSWWWLCKVHISVSTKQICACVAMLWYSSSHRQSRSQRASMCSFISVLPITTWPRGRYENSFCSHEWNFCFRVFSDSRWTHNWACRHHWSQAKTGISGEESLGNEKPPVC